MAGDMTRDREDSVPAPKPEDRPHLVPVMSSYVGQGSDALALFRIWSLVRGERPPRDLATRRRIIR